MPRFMEIRTHSACSGRPELDQEAVELAVRRHFMRMGASRGPFVVLAAGLADDVAAAYLAPPVYRDEEFRYWHFERHQEARCMHDCVNRVGAQQGVGCWIAECPVPIQLMAAE